MQYHVTAILWQCAVSPEHVYGRSDNILPLSRYITIYSSLGQGPCTIRTVCGIKIQMYKTNQFVKSVGYFINGEQCVLIGRSNDNDDCALETYFSKSIGKNNQEGIVYGWHRDGRLKNYSKHNMYHMAYNMTQTPCSQNCSIGTANASIDAFFENALRFRMIRIRRK